MESIPRKDAGFPHANTARLMIWYCLQFALLPTVVFLSLANSPPEPEPAPWKIKGAEAALTDARAGVRSEALKKFGSLKFAGAIPLIVARLKDEDRSVRVTAIQALGAMGAIARSEKQKIAAFLQSQDDELRSEAIRALGAMGKAAEEYAPQILSLMNTDPKVRLEAVTALGAMGAAAKSRIASVAALRLD